MTDAFVVILLLGLQFLPARTSAMVQPGQGEGLRVALSPPAAAARSAGCVAPRPCPVQGSWHRGCDNRGT